MNGERVYPRLVKHFRDADDRYNSGLFHFGEEKDRAEAPDKLTLELDIDDKPLKEIIGSLYYPDCPYEFSVLPADILGQVYEQFLGKVISLTAGHQVKAEERSKGLVPTRALDGPSASRRLSAMQSEPARH